MEFVNELYGAEDEIAAGKFPPPCWLTSSATLCFCLNPLRRTLPTNSGKCWGRRDNASPPSVACLRSRLAKEDEVEYVVQVNGKIRARLSVPADSTEDFVRERALADEKVKAALEGKQI